jgi:thioredoxin-related protein
MRAPIAVLLLATVPISAAVQQQQARDLYDEKADAAAAVEAAKTKAAAENRRVLLVWGSDESTPCKQLDAILEESEKISQKLLYEYDLVRVDADNLELARRFGAEVDKIPHLTVLDAKGAVLAAR